MGGRRVVLKLAMFWLAVVMVLAVFGTTKVVSSMVWGMVTGAHFQSYEVPVVWSVDSLTAPDVTVADANVTGMSVPLEGAVAVTFGEGWNRWLTLEAVKNLVGGAAVVLGTWWLFRVVRDVDRGDRLSVRHGGRLSNIGWLLVLVPPVLGILRLLQPSILDGGSVDAPIGQISIVPVIPVVGLVFLILGAVLRHAAAVDAENALTV